MYNKYTPVRDFFLFLFFIQILLFYVLDGKFVGYLYEHSLVR